MDRNQLEPTASFYVGTPQPVKQMLSDFSPIPTPAQGGRNKIIMARKPIVVIGSINMDLVCRCAHMPRPGETVAGQDLLTIPGGKGANQAVAAAKVGAAGDEVHLVGRVGADDFGQRMLVALREHGVRTDHVTLTEGSSTGCATILVDKAGENSIVVSPGANAKVSPDDVDAAADLSGCHPATGNSVGDRCPCDRALPPRWSEGHP